MSLPRGHVAVVFCGTRLAEQWRAAFAADGIEAAIDETDGADAEKGAWVVSVPKRQVVAANAIVTAVTQGRRKLPPGRGGGGKARTAIAVAVVAALVAALARGLL